MKHAECGGAAAFCALCKWTERVEGIVSGVLAGEASPQLRRKWAGGIVLALIDAGELRPPLDETDAQVGEPRPVEVIIRDEGEGVEFNTETGELRAIPAGPELVEPSMGPAPAVESNAIGPAMPGAVVKDEGLGVVLDSRTGDLLPVKRVRADGTWELGEPAGEAAVATGGRALKFPAALLESPTGVVDGMREDGLPAQSEGDKVTGRIENSLACFELEMSRRLVAHREFVVAALLDAIPAEEEEPEPEPTPDERAVLALDRLQPEMAELYLLGRELVLGGPRPIKTRRQAREMVILLANMDGMRVENLVREIVEAFDAEQEQAKPGISIAQVHDYLREKGWQQEGPETYQLPGVGTVSADERLEEPALVGELVHQIARLELRTMSQVIRDLPDKAVEATPETCAGCRWLEVGDDEGPTPTWRCGKDGGTIPFRHLRCSGFEWSPASVPVDEEVAVGRLDDPAEWLKRVRSGEAKAQADCDQAEWLKRAHSGETKAQADARAEEDSE